MYSGFYNRYTDFMGFLPIEPNGEQFDFICVTGDAYIDHPSIGMAVISRVIESLGYSVAVLAQPNFKNEADFKKLGQPKYAFFVNGGNLDSMVAHYTVAKKRRTRDYYTPGGAMGKRPDRAVTVYSNILKQLYPDTPIIIGGIEASLRRFAHYDYWDDEVKPSILVDSKADLISFGMGERQTKEIAERLARGESIEKLNNIRGTCYLTKELPKLEYTECASYKKVKENKISYAKACKIQVTEHDYINGKTVVQKQDDDLYLVVNPPAAPLSREELDEVFELPFEKNYHPSYEKFGGVPAIEEVKFSLMHNRGCFGNCNFCSLAFHQGRYVTSRSIDSVVKEAEKLTQMPDFKGYINDVGGPTANFRYGACEKQKKVGMCPEKKCLAPFPCPALKADHSEYLTLLRKLREINGVKKVFIRSGIRFDYLMCDKDETFFNELVKYHISGQLKVAPEHCSNRVLGYMGKPDFSIYKKFRNRYDELNKKNNKKQFIVPYLMSSHPGSTLKDALELSLFIRKERLHPEQVQDFYPTPGTISTCMYHTGLDPFTLKEVYVAKDPKDKAMQRALLQYFLPQNRGLVVTALKKMKREDLIGYGKDCLIKPIQNRRR